MYDTKNEWTAYDVTKVSSEEIPYADCWCFGFPCFPRGTKITTEKGLKNIEDIIAGERVLTHENRLKKVLSTMSRKTNEIYTLTIQGAIDTEVTSEHPYLVYKDENTEWVKVKDLKKGDMVGFPVNTKSEIPQCLSEYVRQFGNTAVYKDTQGKALRFSKKQDLRQGVGTALPGGAQNTYRTASQR